MPTDTAEATEVLGNVTKLLSKFTWAEMLTLCLLLLVCLVVRRILMTLVDKTIKRLKVEKSLHTFIRSVFNILLWFIVVLIVADYIGIPVTSLLAVFSLIGLAVSLAIQGTLSNLAGGIMILTAKPFVVGDFVEAAGVAGTVSDIGLVYTQMTTADNKVIFIPNSEISGAKVTNYTNQDRRRVDLTITASYDAPVSRVEETLARVVGSHPQTFATPEPFARVSGYGSSSIEYTVRAWCATADYWQVHFDLLKQIKEAFDQEGIEMTYDHLNVHLKQD